MSAITVRTPTWFAQLAQGLPRPFWALLGGTFVTKAGSFIVPLLFIYLTQARGLPLPLAGAVASLYGFGSLLGALAGGILADRLGRRITMLLSLVLGACFLLVLGFSQSVWALGGAAFLTGLTGDAYRPASQAMVADVVAAPHRLKAFTIQYWAINLGFAVASILGGFMAKRNFTALFVGDAVTTLLLALIVWRAIPESRPQQTSSVTGSAFAPFVDRRFTPFLFLNFLVALLFFQHLSSLPDDMAAKGLSTEAYGLSIATNGVVIVLLQPFVSRWAVGLAPARALAWGAALTGLGFGLTAFAHSLEAYVLTVIIWTVGEVLLAPVNATLVAALSPAHLRGRYQGAFTLTWGLAATAAPLAGSTIIPLVGHRALWFACFAIGLAAAIGHLVWTQRVIPQTDRERLQAAP